MYMRRLPIAAPLALLVAVLAHAAAFGDQHAAGMSHAATLLVVIGVALSAALCAGFVDAALRPKAAIATSGRPAYFGAALVFGGLAAFWAIELLEGHLQLGGALRGSLAVVPAAVVVGWAARRAAVLSERAGSALASLHAVACAIERLAIPVALTAPVPVHTAHIVERRRGRAPPART